MDNGLPPSRPSLRSREFIFNKLEGRDGHIPPGCELGSLCDELIPTYQSPNVDSRFSRAREISCLRGLRE